MIYINDLGKISGYVTYYIATGRRDELIRALAADPDMLLAARRVTEYHPSHRAEDAFAEADSLRAVWAIESALAQKKAR
jgi:hypothetical protein